MQKEPQESQQEEQPLEQRLFAKLNTFYESYFLSELQKVAATKFIKTYFGDQKGNFDHLRPWLLAKINGTRVNPTSSMQKGCPDIIPGLRSQPWWDSQDFPWLRPFQERYKEIRDELLALRNQKGFQPYRGPSWISDRKAKDGVGHQSIDSGTWNVFYLQLHNMKFDKNCEKVPLTMEMINQHIPNSYHHAFYSALTTNSHIMPHHGPTNKKLRFHLPLVGVQGSRMRVGDETREQQEGKAYVFDDSFQHQAWHEGDQTRLILIVDFWHPDLTAVELKLLKVLQNALFKAQAVISESDPQKDNFYSIIQSAKQLIKDNDWWVVGEPQKQ